MARCFVHLQCHTEYSLLEGALRIPKLLKQCQAYDMGAVAITDNGTMFGTMEFYLSAKAMGVNPIIGCELLLTPDISVKERARQKIVLLCKNYKGYQNLIKLVTKSHLEGFYYKPRIDLASLSECVGDLIAISPGYTGPVDSLLLNHQDDDAIEMAIHLKDLYGDNLYLGLRKVGMPYEDMVMNGVSHISQLLSIQKVVTNDVYYMTQDRAYIRDVLACIRTGKRLDSDSRFVSDSQDFFFKSAEDMWQLFPDQPEALENTVRIADQCHIEIETEQVKLPRFSCPDDLSSEAYLEKLVWEGIHRLYPSVTDTIKQRVEFELSLINKMHYANYFLIIYDFLDFCYQQNIPVGPGRGSAAGSIVSYALDITRIDPLKYKLLFERFLNPDRISMPDVDIDFCIRRRGEVIGYIVQKYGQDCVSQIITFGTMQGRAVVRDVGRVLGVPLPEVDRIAKLIPSVPGSYRGIPKALEDVSELKKAYESSADIKKLLDIGIELEGQARHSSTHAAGVVISREPLTTVVPLLQNDGQVATQFAMADIEKIGLLKMDILGLRNLTVMQDSVALIKKNQGIDLDLNNVLLDDKKTYELLCLGKTTGVFQLESRGMRQLIKELKPKVFEDIIALLALYRPGPLGSGMVSDFISNKSGKTTVKYDLPELEPILNETYGMIVYQEQVMQIASVVGGFSLGQADMLRRAMGKKKKDVMDEMKETFLAGAAAKKVPSKIAAKIFDLCVKFAEYGFNKSHSAAYALVSYQTAYLKAHYMEEYMASLLSSVLSVSDKTALYIQECLDMDLLVKSPSVNASYFNFCIETLETETKCIRFGLGAIKNVGQGAIESIIENRPENGYKDIGDFCTKVDLKQVNKRVLESLIKSGAMDNFGDRAYLLAIYEQVMNRAQTLAKERSNGQVGLFGGSSGDGLTLVGLESVEYSALSSTELLTMEKELVGLYISGHPLDAFQDVLGTMTHSTQSLSKKDEGKEVVMAGLFVDCRRIITRNNREMVLSKLEDQKGAVSVLAFQMPGFEELAAHFVDDQMVIVKGKVKLNGDEYSIVASEVIPFQQGAANKALFIDVESIETSTLKNIQKITQQHKGAMPVYLKYGERMILTHKKYWVLDDPLCKTQLESIMGAGRLWVS